MEDSEILELYRSRDESAISRTHDKYSGLLTSVSLNILRDREDSRECVNDTLLRAWNVIPPNFPQRLGCFLCKIARDISISVYRRKHAARRVPSEYAVSLDELAECVSGAEQPEEALDMKLLTAAISRYLGGVSQTRRVEFVQRYFFCDPVDSIAEYSGRSVSAVKSGLLRTRRGLREFLIKEGWNL